MISLPSPTLDDVDDKPPDVATAILLPFVEPNYIIGYELLFPTINVLFTWRTPGIVPPDRGKISK